MLSIRQRTLCYRPCSISFPASPGPQRIFEPPQHKKATDNGDPNPPMPMHHRWIYHPKPPPPTGVGRYRPIMSEEWIVLCTYPYFRCLTHLMSVGAKMTKSPPTQQHTRYIYAPLQPCKPINWRFNAMIRKRGVFLGEGRRTARLFRIDASLFFHYIGTTDCDRRGE